MFDIRRAHPDQFEEIWPIFEEVVKAGESYPFPVDTDLEQGRRFWFAPGADVFIGYLEGRAVASRYIVPNKVGLGSHVANTGVILDRSVRGRGLGKTMLEFGIKKATELGYRALQLNLVVANNHASLAICKKYGFEIVGRLPGAFHFRQQEYVDAFVLYKTLI